MPVLKLGGESHLVTAYQESVYRLVSTIPAGKISTYGHVSKAIAVQAGGAGGCARSVGQAMRKNPFSCAAMP
jgi:O6-methylguanine-DNA--protein-cysteine methyltransferase